MMNLFRLQRVAVLFSGMLLAGAVALKSQPAIGDQPTTKPTTQPAAVVTPPPTPPKTAPVVPAPPPPAPTPGPVPAPGPVKPPAPAPAPLPAPAPVPTPVDHSSEIHGLATRIHQLNDQQHAPVKVAYFDLSTPVVEKPSGFSLLGSDALAITLRSLVERLHKARDDAGLSAVLLNLGTTGANLSQAQEIRDCLIEIRDTGKRVFVYSDGYDTDSYTIATGATDICMLPGGEIMLPGVGIQTMYLKGLFDKLGVKADYVQIGDYKGADEEFTRTNASDQFRGELNKLMDGLYDQVVTGISTNRKMDPAAVKAAIDESILPARAALDRHFIDHLVDIDGLRDLLSDSMDAKADLIADYAAPPKEDLDFSSPFALLALLGKKPAESTKPAVALVYADGVIVDGSSGASLLDGSTIGSDEIRSAMRDIGRDPSIKAVVIRINSPGGSALASEAMWQAVRRVAAKKPVVISVGNMAASGGYYLACAGDRIFADPSAIVGSIGVVGGKFVMKGLYDKIGITTETFSRGKNAGMFGSDEAFTDEQRRMVRQWMTDTYHQFLNRVMTTRGGKIQKIDDVAQGRLFIADKAKDLGMVDEIGGLDAALTYAAAQGHLPAGKLEIRLVPPPKSLLDVLTGTPPASLRAAITPDAGIDTALLKALPPEVRAMACEQLEILQLLQTNPVVLTAPLSIRIKE